jgi:Autotransporter beta-domain
LSCQFHARPGEAGFCREPADNRAGFIDVPAIATNSNAICRSATPNIGQIAASQQQLSFSAVQGVLRTRRDQLQGSLGSQPGAGAPLAYSASNVDESFRLLGYAPDGEKNPVYGADRGPIYKAPPAPAMAAGPAWAAWVEGLGDWEKRNPLNANDVGRTQDTYGVHAGVDATWQNVWLSGDFVVTGLVTNWTSSRINLTGSPASLRLEGPGVGLYSMYVNGRFSADLVGKFDFLNLDEDLAGLGLANGSIGVTNAGVSGNIQYKNQFGASFVEPTAGFSFTRTMFGDNAALMGLQDGSTVRLQAGARFGTAFNANGVSFEPTLALLAYSNVIADGTTVATVAVPVPVTPTDQGLVRGEVDPELNVDFNNGYSAYVRGSFRFGTELVGGFAKVGVRKQF